MNLLERPAEMLGVQEQITRRFRLGYHQGHCIASDAWPGQPHRFASTSPT